MSLILVRRTENKRPETGKFEIWNGGGWSDLNARSVESKLLSAKSGLRKSVSVKLAGILVDSRRRRSHGNRVVDVVR